MKKNRHMSSHEKHRISIVVERQVGPDGQKTSTVRATMTLGALIVILAACLVMTDRLPLSTLAEILFRIFPVQV